MADGTNGNDTFTGTEIDDSYFGLEGDDSLVGGGGDDTLNGGEGNDTLVGGAGSDLLDGGEGDDSLEAVGSHGLEVDALLGGAGNDTLHLINEVVDGFPTSSTFAGTMLDGGDGHDVLAISGAVVLEADFQSLEGIRLMPGLVEGGVIVRQTGQLTLTASQLSAFNNGDPFSVEGGAGQITVLMEPGITSIDLSGHGFGANIGTHVHGTGASETIVGANTGGGDYILTGGGVDILTLGDGADYVLAEGSTSGDHLTVSLGAGPDIIELGAPENGTALFGGLVVVSDFTTGPGGDLLTFQNYLEAARPDWDQMTDPFQMEDPIVRLVQDGADTRLQVELEGAWTTLAVFQNTFRDDFTSDNFQGFNPIAGQLIEGGAGDDTLTGGSVGDTILGGDGADSLSGADGHDSLAGQAGDDTLDGGYGGDTLWGGEGADLLTGGEDDDTLLTNGASADTLSGGAGGDTLSVANLIVNGELISSTFAGTVLDGGDGFDLLGVQGSVPILEADFSGLEGIVFLPSFDGVDENGDSVSAPLAHLGLTASQLFSFNEPPEILGEGVLTIYLEEDVPSIELYPLNFHLDSWVTLEVIGTDADNEVYGPDYANTLVMTGRGDDYVELYDGSDTIVAEQGADEVLTLDLDEGDWLDDGRDTIVLAAPILGEGDEVIRDYTFAGTVVVDGFVTAWQAEFEGIAYDVVDVGSFLVAASDWDPELEEDPFALGYLRVIDVEDGAELQFDADGGGDDWTTLIQFLQVWAGDFDDDNFLGFGPDEGMTLAGDDGADTLGGGLGDDDLNGGAGDDSLAGEGGGDLLQGEAGHDTLSGGFGWDTLQGGEGNDSLLGDGGDDSLEGGAGHDVVSYAGGLIGVQVDLSEMGGQVISPDMGTDTLADIEGVVGTEQSDWIAGDSLDNLLVGADGDDTLMGRAGADTLDGGLGSDSIEGGAGDSLSGGQGDDLIVAGPVLLDEVLSVTLGEGRDTLTLAPPGEEEDSVGVVVVTDFFTGEGGDVVDLRDYLGAVLGDWDPGDDPFQIEGPVLRLAPGDTGATLEFNTGDGWVTLIVFQGVDATSFTSDNFAGGYEPVVGEVIVGTEDNDTLSGGVGQDTLTGAGGDDSLSGAEARDQLSGQMGDDTLAGEAGDDALLGGAGNDLLLGGEGGDQLQTIGHPGADTLSGGAGDDGLGVTNLQANGEAITSTFAGTILDGGDGFDTLVIQGVHASLQADLQNLEALLLAPSFNGEVDGDFIEISPAYVVLTSSQFHSLNGPEALPDIAGEGAISILLDPEDEGIDLSELNILGEVFVGVVGTDADEEIIGPANASTFILTGRGNDMVAVGAGGDTIVAEQGEGEVLQLSLFGSGTPDDGMDVITLGGPIVDEYGAYSRNNAFAGQVVVVGFATAAEANELGAPYDVVEFESFLETSAGWTSDDGDPFALELLRLVGVGESAELQFDADGGGDEWVTLVRFEYAQDADFDAQNFGGWDVRSALELTGGEEADTLGGGLGNDVVDGDAGNDSLSGEGGNDTVDGGSGDDTVAAGAGDDVLVGGDGNDVLSFAGATSGVVVDLVNAGGQLVSEELGVKTISGFEGVIGTGEDDTLIGNGSDNVFTGGGGSDSLDGAAGNDVAVFSGARSDYEIYYDPDGYFIVTDAREASPDGVDTLYNIESLQFSDGVYDPFAGVEETGGAGDDILTGALAADTLSGLGGQDLLDGLAGDDSLDGGAAADTLNGGDGGDSLLGGEGDDWLDAGAGNNSLAGGSGHDRLSADAGDDVFDGGDGFDHVGFGYASAGVTVNLTLAGAQNTGFGSDILSGIEHLGGSSYNDTLIGDGADNWLSGFLGDDSISGGDGNDLIVVLSTGSHVVAGDDGVDTAGFWGGAGVSVSLAEAGAQDMGLGTVTLTGVENLAGGEQDDTLTGDGAANVLAGAAGDDVLSGGDGNDLILGDGLIGGSNPSGSAGAIQTLQDDGGAGADTLTGGAGDDTMVGGGGTDVVVYGGSRWSFEVTVNGDGSITVTGPDGTDTLIGVERIEFADATVVPGQGDSLTGGASDDLLTGGTGHDTLLGQAGHDTLLGGSGNDSLDGGDGSDTASYVDATVGVTVNLSIAAGQNTGWGFDTLTGIEHLIGSDHSDNLTGGEGSNSMFGGAGGDDTLSGGGGTDVFVVGAGNHVVTGGAGTDYLVFDGAGVTGGVNVSLLATGAQNTGQGSMTLSEIEGLIGTDFADTLAGGAGENVLSGGAGDDVLVSGAGNDMIDGGDGVDTVDYANASGGVIADLGDIGVSNGDGEDTLANVENAIGSAFGDSVTGSSLANEISGHDGGDRLDGLDGDDTLLGAAGSDSLTGGLGHDVLSGGDGLDLLTAGGGNDSLDGGAGMDVASFVGGPPVAIDLTVTGSQATMNGSVILIAIEHAFGSAGNDTLQGDDEGNLLWGAGGDDVLHGRGGDDLLMVNAGDHLVSGGDGVDTISFQAVSGGVSFDLNNGQQGTGHGTVDGVSLERVSGGDGGDSLTGASSSDTLAGNGGGDWLTDTAGGADLLVGDGFYGLNDAGEIVLIETPDVAGADTISSSGADTIRAGGGNDVVTVDVAAGETATVSLGAGQDELNLDPASEGVVVVTDFQAGAGGDVIDLAALLAVRAPTWDGVSNPFEGGFLRLRQDGSTAVIEIDADGGTANGVTLLRLESVSALSLTAHNIGWTPVAQLQGGAGADTFHWTPGGANASVDGGDGVDVLEVTAPALDPGDEVTVTTDPTGQFVLIDVDGDGETDLTVSNVEDLILNGERVVLTGDFRNTGLAADTIHFTGTVGDDVFDAELMTSTESIEADGLDGADNIIGADGDDLLTGGAGADTLVGRGDADTLNGGSEGDLLDGGEGADSLDGGGGFDSLVGGAGADTMNGADGNDSIDGGAGVDVVVFAGDSADYDITVEPDGDLVVVGMDGTDILVGVERLRFDDGEFGQNTAPTGQDRSVSMLVGGTRVLTAADFGFGDADGDSLAGVVITTVPASGQLTLNGAPVTAGTFVTAAQIAANQLVFTPAGAGTATFTFQVRDDGLADWGSNTDASANTLSISVNTPPSGGGGGSSPPTATPGPDLAIFGQPNDSFSAGDGADTVLAGGGDDWVHGNLGADSLVGGEGLDTLHGGQGDDQVNGDAGNDAVFGDRGNDSVFGGAGDDLVDGGDGSNFLRGGDGNDVVTGGSGFDDAHGNIGDDTVNGAGGDDWVVGGQGQDLLFGGEGWDVSLGNLGSDTIYGGQGGDWLRGGQADDAIYGEDGDDWMSGDRGADTLVGGAGADVFHTWTDAGVDRVLDFSVLDGDRVNLLAGTTYSVAQVGVDTVITMGDSQMVLVGVQLSTLPEGWIFGA